MQVYSPTAAAAFAPYAAAAQDFDAPMSVLVIADRLLTLAQEAERAGLMDSADRLVRLAHDVFDEEAGVDLFDEQAEMDF